MFLQESQEANLEQHCSPFQLLGQRKMPQHSSGCVTYSDKSFDIATVVIGFLPESASIQPY
jgi:hypothetical protein